MAAESVLMEALLRIEHKLDLLLSEEIRPKNNPRPIAFELEPVGDPKHHCPVCAKKVEYVIDALNKVVARKCGCSTGKIAPIDLGAFAPPVIEPRHRKSNGNAADEEESEHDRLGGSFRRR